MAKKTTGNSKSSPDARPAAKVAAKPIATEVRNTARPPKAMGTAAPAVSAARTEITHDMICRRAYEIWQRSGGSDVDNWCQAERELRGR